jgi:magnesium-transporting ATPase (P-type)
MHTYTHTFSLSHSLTAIESALDNDKTPLQERLEKLAVVIGKVGLAVAIMVFILLTIWWFVNDVCIRKRDINFVVIGFFNYCGFVNFLSSLDAKMVILGIGET